MSPDRVVYSFILGWVVLITVLIALDWLGNPNRGGFRPKGERPSRGRAARRAERRRRRLESDAAVRATLRDAYGASSLRLTWSGSQEDRARQVDDALVVVEPVGDIVDASSREVVGLDHTAIIGDPLPNVEEDPPDVSGSLDEPDTSAEPEATEATTEIDNDPSPIETVRPVGWKVGVDPLALTARGEEPAPATIRSRVWKNHGASGSWDPENLARLRAGKPPRRTNPMTGRVERASVDVTTGRATWGTEPVDPFADEP
jgi:hypothetical protein